MDLLPQSVVIRDDEPIAAKVDGEVVMLSARAESYFGLDAMGTRLWHLVAEHGSSALVIETLLAEYDVDALRLQKDVEGLIDQLLAKGLLTTNAEQTPTAR